MRSLIISIVFITPALLYGVDLPKLIENRDFSFTESSIHTPKDVMSDYEYIHKNNVKTYSRYEGNYILSVENQFASKNISRISEIQRQSTHYWQHILGTPVRKTSKGSTSTLNHEGELLSRSVCEYSRHGEEEKYNCTTITREKCLKAFSLDKDLHKDTMQMLQCQTQENKDNPNCTTIRDKINSLLNHQGAQKEEAINWNALKEDMYLPEWNKRNDTKIEKDLVGAHIKFRDTVDMCDRYFDYFQIRVIHPGSYSDEKKKSSIKDL